MLQAMSCGLPVIVSPVGMNNEVLSHGRCGFAAETLGQWSESLAQLYEEESLRAAMGTVGRGVVETRYSVPVVAAKIADAFTKWTRSTNPV
jgi:glycosyltransferase involved in cell wall biosynthesis